MENSIKNFIKNIPKIHMHYVAKGISALATLRPENSNLIISTINEKLKTGI